MREVVIASAVRTAVGKSSKGTLRATRPDDLAAVAIMGALERIPQLDKKEIEDVIIGCATPEAEQGMNVARIASLRAGLPVEVSALTINRLQTRRAEAIDGERRDLNRQSRAQRGDASDVHPLLGFGHCAAKDDIVYFFRIDLRYALQSALDGDSTEFIRTRRPQHAFESTSHRCAHRRNENDFTHKNSYRIAEKLVCNRFGKGM